MGKPALEEFRERFTETLMETLTDVGANRIRAAVDKATEDWDAKIDHDLVRDALGKVVDEVRAPQIKTVEPVTRIVRITVTGRIVRDETDAERQAHEERIEAALWHPEDGPPPKRVSAVRLLEQRVWWVPREEPPIKLKDMAPSHRKHLLAFLRRNAARYKQYAEVQFIGLATGPMGPGGDAATDAVNSAMDELFNQSPKDWLEEQPLVKRLAKMVTRDERRAAHAAEVSG